MLNKNGVHVVSFFNTVNENNYSWFVNSSFAREDINLDRIEFDTLSQVWGLKKGINNLKVGSAGFLDGTYASIQYNFLEQVSNTFFRGFATALVDEIDLHPYNVRTFEYPVTPSRDSLISYLNSLNNGSIIAIAATDEVSTFFSGTVGNNLKQTLKGFGSVYVDSIGFRDSWAMIGIKGAAQGTVPEAFSKSLQGPAVIDTSKLVQFSNGTIQFPIVENSVKWLNVIRNDSIPAGASINYYPIGYRNNGEADTLNSLQFISNEASIESIDVKTYKKISILAELNANSSYESPEIKELAINFVPPPELGINYQVVSIEKDSVQQGEDAKLSFYVYNVGKSQADSFNVVVEIVNPDNSRQKIFDEVNSIGAEQKKLFNVSFNTANDKGNKSFYISIDSDNKVTELYEDNNFYTVPFFIKADTTKPSLIVSFNGNDIMDGDYVSPTSTIRMELSDPSNLPIADTSSIAIQLDDIPIYFAQNPSILSYTFNPNNPKMIVEYKPLLESGEHNLRVFANDGFGNISDSAGFQKRFLVSGETKILNIYNYPNPIINENTYFTFRLTQVPDQLKIMVYTIAGRLVKEIVKTSAELNIDFNKIFWDTRDEDGDLLGNGTYLYKVIMNAGDKTETSVNKLAIVR